MTYVIALPCVDLKDKACIEECPVDCIYEGGRMLYIQPDECVDCGACEPVCPVEAIFAEDDSDFMPITSDSISETVPRSIGFFRMGYRSLIECTGFVSTCIFLPGSRTAVAVSPGPRIMTPSMTAWPPTINLSLNGIPPYLEIPIASILQIALYSK